MTESFFFFLWGWIKWRQLWHSCCLRLSISKLMFRQQRANLLFLSHVSKHFQRSCLCHSLIRASLISPTPVCLSPTLLPRWACLHNDTPLPHLSLSSSAGWLCLVPPRGPQLKAAPLPSSILFLYFLSPCDLCPCFDSCCFHQPAK